jgi:hypothetical protein
MRCLIGQQLRARGDGNGAHRRVVTHGPALSPERGGLIKRQVLGMECMWRTRNWYPVPSLFTHRSEIAQPRDNCHQHTRRGIYFAHIIHRITFDIFNGSTSLHPILSQKPGSYYASAHNPDKLWRNTSYIGAQA